MQQQASLLEMDSVISEKAKSTFKFFMTSIYKGLSYLR